MVHLHAFWSLPTGVGAPVANGLSDEEMQNVISLVQSASPMMNSEQLHALASLVKE